jgi:hypothetical protein
MQLTANSPKLPIILANKFAAMHDMYGRYCAGLPKAQQMYEEKLQDKKFVKFEASIPNMNKPTLNHFMRPFQVCVGRCNLNSRGQEELTTALPPSARS